MSRCCRNTHRREDCSSVTCSRQSIGRPSTLCRMAMWVMVAASGAPCARGPVDAPGGRGMRSSVTPCAIWSHCGGASSAWSRCQVWPRSLQLQVTSVADQGQGPDKACCQYASGHAQVHRPAISPSTHQRSSGAVSLRKCGPCGDAANDGRCRGELRCGWHGIWCTGAGGSSRGSAKRDRAINQSTTHCAIARCWRWSRYLGSACSV